MHSWEQSIICTVNTNTFEYWPVLARSLGTAYSDTHTCVGRVSCDGTEDWQDRTAWDIAGVSLCLSVRPLIAAIWQFNLRGAEQSSRLVTRAGHYWAWRQPIASAINDKGSRGGESKKWEEEWREAGLKEIRGWEREWRCKDDGRERRGEEWKDKSSYAAEGQFLVVEWMTNRLSADQGMEIFIRCCTTKKIWALSRAHKSAQTQSLPQQLDWECSRGI